MSSRHEKDAWRPKKPYTKPEVKQVQLKPEEAVLGGCKLTVSDSGPGTVCAPAPCSTITS